MRIGSGLHAAATLRVVPSLASAHTSEFGVWANTSPLSTVRVQEAASAGRVTMVDVGPSKKMVLPIANSTATAIDTGKFS